MPFNFMCAKRLFTFRRRAKCGAGQPSAPLRQSYSLPNPNSHHPHLHETVPYFSLARKTRRRQPPRAGAPKLSPAESKWTSNSLCCALPRGADIRPSAGAFPAPPRAGAIRVLFTRLGPSHGSPVEARCVSRTCRFAEYNAIWPPGGSRWRAGCAKWCSRHSAVHISFENDAPAPAWCSFSLFGRS